jgi:hypothetical protein
MFERMNQILTGSKYPNILLLLEHVGTLQFIYVPRSIAGATFSAMVQRAGNSRNLDGPFRL